jgi:hypothetical protein
MHHPRGDADAVTPAEVVAGSADVVRTSEPDTETVTEPSRDALPRSVVESVCRRDAVALGVACDTLAVVDGVACAVAEAVAVSV